MVKPTKTPNRIRIVFDVLVTVFSLLFVIATIATVVSLLAVNELLANASHVDGLVVDMKNGAKGTQAPVVRFQTANGETIQAESNLYTSPAPKVGDTLKVVYRTSNPHDWQIDDWIHLYFWTFMGSIFMIAWATATIVTKLVGVYQVRKLEAPENITTQRS